MVKICSGEFSINSQDKVLIITVQGSWIVNIARDQSVELATSGIVIVIVHQAGWIW